LSDAEGAKVRAWLDSIGEDDPEIRDEVLDRCETVREARDYFLGLAGEALGADNWDDQRTCGECANLIAGQCRAARWGGPLSQRPIRDLPRRCEGYAPGADDSDRRHGRERWPGLSSERG
jgi:hypothetical protein